MEKNRTAEQQGQEEWIKELLSISEEEKMTPKQLAILQAGIEVFSEKGYAAAATSEIAQKAGVAEGTIFRYYKTKKELLLSIVSPAMTKMIAPFVMRKFDGVLDLPFDSYEAFLRAFMINRLEFARNNFKILRIFIQEIPFQPVLREQFIENVLAQVLERVTAITEHFKEKGEVIDAPAPSIIRFTISSVIGYLLTRLLLMPDKDWDDEAEINLTIDFILHGISGPSLRREDQ
ncbi:TetR/AcrR family transcriptional regulator [Paenibacillus sp. S150]|uniref:TetR/AcrR family transcriptional regulator n=1 Tax=Paenibacillus sp. S150 TaxID=2749826 RepID=UPI001C573D38|nr:TetR/AcrR family transcriptional regulator [Paenibacillus sp. S150]MBW4081131.1 TetR/AcrR family transcriptional regulator [Paenibacillus sp. S150]